MKQEKKKGTDLRGRVEELGVAAGAAAGAAAAGGWLLRRIALLRFCELSY